MFHLGVQSQRIRLVDLRLSQHATLPVRFPSRISWVMTGRGYFRIDIFTRCLLKAASQISRDYVASAILWAHMKWITGKQNKGFFIGHRHAHTIVFPNDLRVAGIVDYLIPLLVGDGDGIAHTDFFQYA